MAVSVSSESRSPLTQLGIVDEKNIVDENEVIDRELAPKDPTFRDRRQFSIDIYLQDVETASRALHDFMNIAEAKLERRRSFAEGQQFRRVRRGKDLYVRSAGRRMVVNLSSWADIMKADAWKSEVRKQALDRADQLDSTSEELRQAIKGEADEEEPLV